MRRPRPRTLCGPLPTPRSVERYPDYWTRPAPTLDSVIPVTTVMDDAPKADQIFGLQRVTERAVSAGYLAGS